MTADEIIELARHNSPMPAEFTLAEQMLYKSMRLTYDSYKRGLIDKAQGTSERKTAVRLFERYKLAEKSYRDLARRGKAIGELLCKINKDGCELCKQMAKIYDGRLPVKEEFK